MNSDNMSYLTCQNPEESMFQYPSLKEIEKEWIRPVLHEPVVSTNDAYITIGSGSRIDSFVKLEGGAGIRIGKFVHIASFAHINIGGGETVLEDYSAVASGAKIVSGSNLACAPSMSACAPAELQRRKAGKVVLRRFSIIFTNAVVLPGVTLHEGAILAAGGVATKDIPTMEIWGGVPAQRIGFRKLTPCSGCVHPDSLGTKGTNEKPWCQCNCHLLPR